MRMATAAGSKRSRSTTSNPGEVVVKTAYSSVNFKDALAGTGQGKILRRFPLVGGIDVAGHVVASTDPAFREGDAVLVTGSGLSETRDGGYADFARLESKWVVALPDGLSLRESMILGTAGFTAALALLRMEDNRQSPELGPLAVTGATGGVGSLAVAIFAKAGYEVHAVSGKADQAGYLKSLGASTVLGRDALSTTRPLDTARFGGGLDNVGGPMLAALLAQTAPYGNVASAGLAASPDLACDGDALHHPRRVPAGSRLGRHRARPARGSLATAGRGLEAAQPGRDLHPRNRTGRAARGLRDDAGRGLAGPYRGAPLDLARKSHRSRLRAQRRPLQSARIHGEPQWHAS